MDRIDKSLDDIIKTQKQARKKPAQKPAPPKNGLKTRTAIRIDKVTRGAKPKSPYTRPGAIKKESALFTESYKSMTAPVTEIFTAGYIPKPTATLKLFTINNKANVKTQKSVAAQLTSAPLRLVTTQRVQQGKALPVAPAASNSGGEDRIPTEPASMRANRHDNYHASNERNLQNNSTNSRSNGNSRVNDRQRNGTPIGHARPSTDNRENHRNGGNHGSNSKQGGHPAPVRNNNHVNGKRMAGRHDTNGPAQPIAVEDMSTDMDIDDGVVSIRGVAPASVAFRGESGPVTIEIENLDPGTTAEDVKFVCSRFGEIKSCMCTNGYSQVTYVRKAAGLAAIENLNGKKADNGQILRVTMRQSPIIHEASPVQAPYVPSPIAGPMKILTKAVQGTITNAGTLYSDQLLAAQQMLKVQQHRMAQLHQEEQRIASLRTQSSQMDNLTSSNRGFF